MTQRTLIPLFLVGLPIGLAVSIVIALYLYYHPIDFPLPSRPERASVSAFLRRSPDLQSLREYRRILTTDLAPAAARDASRQSAVANWIESTLGPSNLGLPVKRTGNTPDPTSPGAPASGLPSLVIELEGTRRRNEVLVVISGYQGGVAGIDHAVSTATLMSVSRAFVGTSQRRTLVFAFLPGEAPDPLGRSPLDSVVQSLKLRNLAVTGVLDLRVGGPAPIATGNTASRGQIVAVAPREGAAWTGEVREAFASRKPEGVSFQFREAAEAPEAAAFLAGWRSAPAPYVLLHLTPAAADDEASPLALARSLESVLQSLANP